MSTQGSPRKVIDWLNVLGVVVPVIFVVGGWTFGTMQPTDSAKIQFLIFALTAVFGFCLSNLIRNFDLAKKFEELSERELSKSSEIELKLDRVIAQSRILEKFTEDHELAAIELYVRWLSANKMLSQSVVEVAQFCEWQRQQIQNLLSARARECRDLEILVDDAVKELTSNTDLLVTIPKEEVTAISFEDTLFWVSDEGQRFLEAHKQVLARGVRITRIFVVKGSEEADLSSVMDEQAGLGIEVYVVELSAVQHLNPGDAVIYDKRLVRSGYDSVETRNNMFKRAKLIARQEVVTAELERAQALKAVAKKWPSNDKI